VSVSPTASPTATPTVSPATQITVKTKDGIMKIGTGNGSGEDQTAKSTLTPRTPVKSVTDPAEENKTSHE
jgi:hypothetical protein